MSIIQEEVSNMSKANGYILVNTFNSTYDGTPYIALYGKKYSCLEYNQKANANLKEMLFIQEQPIS